MKKIWYNKLTEYTAYCDYMDENVDSIYIQDKSPFQSEIMSMISYQKINTIYESNLIEDSGLPKEATRKIINEFFPSLPAQPNEYKEFSIKNSIENAIDKYTNENNITELQSAISQINNRSAIQPSLQFRNKNRAQREVAQHFLALEEISEYGLLSLLLRSLQELKAHDKWPELKAKLLENKTIGPLIDRENLFLNEDEVRSIHKILANGLLPKNAGVSAGEYRIDERGVGDDSIKFPSPDLVPSCMQNWITESNKILLAMWNKSITACEAAALISYKFVWIHPFPDFNGRMSRLIMNYVLHCAGKTIPIDLRGGSKNKHKYIWALKQANRNKITPLASLIAQRRTEVFENLEKNLLSAGFPFIGTRPVY